MNATETAAVLALMHVAWPSATLTENSAPVWSEMLIGTDPRDGMTAAKSLMRSAKWFPSIAEFVTATQAACRTRTGNAEGRERPPVAELGEVPFSRDEARANIARLQTLMRRTLAAGKGVEHLHGDKGPCSVPGCPSVTTQDAAEARWWAADAFLDAPGTRPHTVTKAEVHEDF